MELGLPTETSIPGNPQEGHLETILDTRLCWEGPKGSL